MNSYLKAVAVQATSIVLAALAAALLTYIQATINQMGAENFPSADPKTAGALGGTLKAIHSSFLASRGKM
jgi:hypothetical protein